MGLRLHHPGRVVGPVVLAAYLMAGAAAASAGAAAKIEVDPEDDPLTITGRAGDDEGLVGDVRLRSNVEIDDFVFLPSRLRLEGGSTVLRRRQVELIGPDRRLAPDRFTEFEVKVRGVTIPGRYSGTLVFLAPGAGRSAATELKLTVDAHGDPPLAPVAGSDKLLRSLTQCERCAVARWFLQDRNFEERVTLRFASGFRAESVTDVEVIAEGERSGYQLRKEDLGLAAGAPVKSEAGKFLTLPLVLDRNGIPADHYAGTLSLKLEGRDVRFEVPIDLKVRAPPWGAMFAILAGLLLGRVARRVQEGGGTLDVRKPHVVTANALGVSADRLGGLANGIARTLFAALLLFFLFLTGLETLYVRDGETFGSNKIFDYSALIVWGLGADVAQRTLANFKTGG